MATASNHAADLADEDPCDEPDAIAPARCAVAACAEIVAGKWTLLVVRDLADGPRCFSDLEASLVGISPRTLTDRLRLLVDHGLVTRTRIRGVPPRSMYALTERGRSLVRVVAVMREVGASLFDATPSSDV